MFTELTEWLSDARTLVLAFAGVALLVATIAVGVMKRSLLAAFGVPFLLCIHDGADGSSNGEDRAAAQIAAVALALCGCASLCSSIRITAKL